MTPFGLKRLFIFVALVAAAVGFLRAALTLPLPERSQAQAILFVAAYIAGGAATVVIDDLGFGKELRERLF